MSCVREASPQLPDDHLRHDIKKRRFLQPLRGLRRIFRRKGRPVISAASEGNVDAVLTLRSKEHFDPCEQLVEVTNLEPARSHSTSQLTADQIDSSQRRSLQSTLLSVSHDSVFTSEHRSADSGSETSLHLHTRLGFPHSSVRAELFEAVRRRRVQENVSDDEDLGLPRSPASNSPTTAEDMFTKENIVTKSSQSTCSDGSLLSMGSSEIDEESYYQSSRHSSRLSLYEKRTSTGSDIQHNNDRSSNSLNGGAASALCHSAAKHKMAVKPKRNHGVPPKKRQLITSNTLPATPEVNEENNVRTSSWSRGKSVADTRHSDEHQTNQNYVYKARTENHTGITQVNSCDRDRFDTTQSKCCSPPKDISLSPSPSFKLLTRGKLNAMPQLCTSIYDDVAVDEKNTCKREEGGTSFFSRLLLRRSSKKKRTMIEDMETATKEECEMQNENVKVIEHILSSHTKDESSSMAYVNGGLTNAMKHHPMFRQRVEPLNLTSLENLKRTKISYSSTVPVNMGEDVAVLESAAVTDVGKSNVQKSHSFRNNEQLPCMRYEDATPSLPVNIGLVEQREAALLTFSRQFPQADERDCSPDVSAGVYESVNFIKEMNKLKPLSKVPEYSNISTLNNTLNINVNDEVELISTSGNDNRKSASICDMKVPVPAPRTSLLNKTSSINRSGDKDENRDSNENDVSVTITEISDGQRSIISIGGRVSATSDIDIDDSVFLESNLPDSVDTVPCADDSLDDVFAPMTEPTRMGMSTDEPVEYKEKRSEDALLTNESLPQTEALSKTENEKEKEHNNVPAIVVQDAQPTLISMPDEEKSVGIPSDSLTDLMKPSIVCDAKSGTVRINDTVVVMRKKSAREVSRANDEEPELMKVFARRSLKLKETDSLEEILQDVVKSRDSDKENEDANCPVEQRKKQDEISDLPAKLPFAKFQRSISHDVVLVTNVNEKRQRRKSVSSDMEKSVQPSSTEEKVDVPSVEEKIITPFKRIQQRREEWEKRAQQATKVYGAK